MNAFEILVIILSMTLAIFLIIAIVLVVLLVKVSLQIKRVTESAGRTASSIESAMQGVTNVASKAALGKLLSKGFKIIRKTRK